LLSKEELDDIRLLVRRLEAAQIPSTRTFVLRELGYEVTRLLAHIDELTDILLDVVYEACERGGQGELHHNWQWPYLNAFDVLLRLNRLKYVSTIHGLARLVEKEG